MCPCDWSSDVCSSDLKGGAAVFGADFEGGGEGDGYLAAVGGDVRGVSVREGVEEGGFAMESAAGDYGDTGGNAETRDADGRTVVIEDGCGEPNAERVWRFKWYAFGNRHRARVGPYTSACALAETCVFAKQLLVRNLLIQMVI